MIDIRRCIFRTVVSYPLTDKPRGKPDLIITAPLGSDLGWHLSAEQAIVGQRRGLLFGARLEKLDIRWGVGHGRI